MSETKVLNLASDICGRQVRVAGTFETTGVVTDGIIHPTEGRLLGFILRTRAGAERRLAAHRLSIGEQLVASSEGSSKDDAVTNLAHGVTARGELLGAEVVTDDGQLLGRVAEVHVSDSDDKIFYTVAPSGVSRFFTEPFHLPGDLPHAYSASGKRLFISVAAAEETQATGMASFLSSPRWHFAGISGMTRSFVARHGLMLWFTLTALLLGGMLYL